MITYKMSSNKDPSSYLSHHGVKGQKWGVRNYQNEDGTLKKSNKKQGLKTAGLLTGGAAIGATAIGAAWYLKNKSTKKALHQKRVAAAAKANATKAARKASGAYRTFKNVDVTISKGSDFVKSFTNVKLAKLLNT